ncbi:Fc.00g045670.m01.CDS01 [Cosmosporella sp. VM-42]
MVPRLSVLSTVVALGLAISAHTANEYIWPNARIDVLESMLYEQSGREANSPASFVVPCGKVPFGAGRGGPAEWLRTAYHDMATANVVAGTGGIDASIGFELDRDENAGSAFNETLGNMVQYLTSRSSMADLEDLCYGPRPKGVPKPEEDLETHLSAFERQGFSKEEMIGLVACGHTLGGVHGVDVPEIVDVVNDTETDDNTQNFDTTIDGLGAFDNTVALQFIGNVSQNSLAFGHNETTRSDSRIFNSDGGSLIHKMAASNEFFHQTCASLLERMLNTVPKKVTLTDPIQVIPVKPSRLFATINSNGTMTVTGHVRQIDTIEHNPNREVMIHFYPRSGKECFQTSPCIADKALAADTFWTTVLYGPDPLTFKKWAFSTEVSLSQGISGFDVEVIDTVNGAVNSTMYTNGGNGFPFDDMVVTQPLLSCGEQSSMGALNLTIAVRDEAKFTSLKAIVKVPTPLNSLTPQVNSTIIDLVKTGVIPRTNYTLYTALHFSEVGSYTRTYNLIASSSKDTVENFNEIYGIPKCPFGFGSDK